MRFIGERPAHDLTFSDVFLVPSRSEIRSRFDVSLEPGDGSAATVPIVAANMNSVTGPRLAAALARRGGIGILPQDLPPQELAVALAWVKDQPLRHDGGIRVSATAKVADALRLVPAVAGFGVLLENESGEVTGVVPAERLRGERHTVPLLALLSDAPPQLDFEELETDRSVFDVMAAAEITFATVTNHGRTVGTISRTGALRSTIYQPAVDASGRLAVGAAIGISGDVAAKARAVVSGGADLIVVDTAHGHQAGMLRAVETVAQLQLGVPIVAGNVVTASGVRELVRAGADIIKVGVGPGAMCTTRMMTAVGRPQFSAVLEAAEAATSLGARVWADGGIRYPRDVALALAAGASSVMIGSWFAGTVEAPGSLETDEQGRDYKESWGMASNKAVLARFGRLGPYELARRALFAEGISSSRIYLDPLRPSIEDLLDMITAGLRSSLSYAGADSLQSFRERALVGVQSAAGYEEGKALPVSW